MAESMVPTRFQQRHVRAVRLVCTSAADGSVTQSTGMLGGCFLERIVIVPDTTDVPSAAFDLTISTPAAQGAIDVLGAGGANLVNNANVDQQPMVGGTPAVVGRYPLFGNLDIALTNMGDSKKVTIWLFGALFS